LISRFYAWPYLWTMRSFILLFVLLLAASLHAQQWNWAVSAGGTSNNDHFLGIASDSEGNLYGVGTVRATADFGCGILAPGNSNGGFIAKYGPDGECIWVQGIISNGIGAWIYDIAIDHEDRIYIAGNYRGTTTFGSGISLSASNRTWFVARYDTNGNCEWAKRGGSTSTGELSEATGIAVDDEGTIYVTGTASGNTLTFAPISVSNPNTNSTQLVLAAYNSSGDALWARSTTGPGYDIKTTNDIAVANGRLFITGRVGFNQVVYDGLQLAPDATGSYVYVLGCDLQGNGLWSQSFGNGAHEGMSIAADTLGNLFVAGLMRGTMVLPDGTLTSTSPSNDDILLVGLAQDGTYRWGKSTGSIAREVAWAITPDNKGNAYMAGYFQNTIDFFGTPLTSLGGADAVIAKIEADGDVAWAHRAGGTGGGNDYALAIHRRSVEPHTLSFGGYYSLTATYGNTTITENGNHDGMLVSGIDTTFHVSTHSVATCGSNCSGQAYAFVNGTAPYTFQWANGSTTPAIVGLCEDAYSVTVTDASGNVSTVTVDVEEAQDPGYSIQVDGDSLSVNGGSGWQWHLDGAPIAGAESSSFIAPQTGEYFAQVTDMSGCSWSTGPVMVVLNVSVPEMENDVLKFWPNPVDDVLFIEWNGDRIHGRLLNGTGAEVGGVTLQNGRNSIAMQGLVPGLYLFKFTDGTTFRVLKR
jgi:hypothetical protein